MKINTKKAKEIAKILNIDLRKFPLKLWKKAIEIELEHGLRDKRTNVTDNNLIMTAKIALAHIIEYPDYYQRLHVMEKKAGKFWRNKRKPNIFKSNKNH